MDVIVSVRHFELNDEIKKQAVDMINAAFGEFRLKISQVSLVLDMQKELVKASINVGIKDYPVTAESAGYDTVYKALEEVLTKSEIQARRYLDKKQEHRSQSLRDAEQEQTARDA